MQALVFTLLSVFDATRDLFQTLKIKEKRDYELSLRSKGYPSSRRIEYVEDEDLGRDEDLVMDKAAVTRQFEIGFQKIGSQFAVGDGTSHWTMHAKFEKLIVCRSFVSCCSSSTDHCITERLGDNLLIRPYIFRLYLSSAVEPHCSITSSRNICSRYSRSSSTKTTGTSTANTSFITFTCRTIPWWSRNTVSCDRTWFRISLYFPCKVSRAHSTPERESSEHHRSRHMAQSSQARPHRYRHDFHDWSNIIWHEICPS